MKACLGSRVAVVTAPFSFSGVPPSGGTFEAQAVLLGILQQQQVREGRWAGTIGGSWPLPASFEEGLGHPALESQVSSLGDHGDPTQR